MKRVTVWFNGGAPNIHDMIRLMKEGNQEGNIELLVSNTYEQCAAFQVADDSFVEPSLISDEDYLEFCLDICRSRHIDLFIPVRCAEYLAGYLHEFEKINTTLLAIANPSNLSVLEDKAEFALSCQAASLPVADYQVFYDLAEFDQSWHSMREKYNQLCVKPAKGIFASGFRVLYEDLNEFDSMIMSRGFKCPLESFRRALSSSDEPRKFLLMEFLPGVERSIDCYAKEGKLKIAIVRKKIKIEDTNRTYQLLDQNDQALKFAEALTLKFKLNGIFNFQTIENFKGQQNILEVNTRASGGILYTAFSGVNIPYWAVMISLGLRDENELPSTFNQAEVYPVKGATPRLLS